MAHRYQNVHDAHSMVATDIDYYQVEKRNCYDLISIAFSVPHSPIILILCLARSIRLVRSPISILLLELNENNSCRKWKDGW